MIHIILLLLLALTGVTEDAPASPLEVVTDWPPAVDCDLVPELCVDPNPSELPGPRP